MGDCLLLTGADGYVGRRLRDRLRSHVEVVGVSRQGQADVTCDLADAGAVAALERELTPRWIVHAAGNKNVKVCERDPNVAMVANVDTTMNLLRAWPDVPMLYVSTDHVFCGTRGRYTEASPVSPSTAYGRSKLCAELGGRLRAPSSFTAVRVSALYDKAATFLSFLSTELSAGRPVDCFVDAFYSPTYFDDFAEALVTLLDGAERPSVVHVAGVRTSRYDFAREYAAAFGFDEDLIRPARLDEGQTSLFPDLSLDTRLARAQLGFVPTEHRTALRQITEENTMQILKPYRRFDDARGRMLGVINDDEWEEINYVETEASCVRGGHYHQHTRELFLLISGTIKVRVRVLGRRDIQERTLSAGSIFVVEPGEAHWLETLTPCTWINALSKRFDEAAPDIVPVAA